MTTDCSSHLNLWTIHRQQLTVTFDGGQLVEDAGLLSLRAFDKRLGFLADLAQRLPDPRYQPFVTHTAEDLLTQHVYQLLAGYPDANDADHTRYDPLFQTLTDVVPDPQRPLSSRSTLSRFQYAYTSRQHQLPAEDRPAFRDMYTAQTRRLFVLNDFLVDWFVRTRRQPPAHVVIDLDATDDPTHGDQALSGYHGYYGQHCRTATTEANGNGRGAPTCQTDKRQ